MKYPKGFNTIIPAYPYQKETIILGILYKNPGILLDVGLGKTFCAINIARYYLQANEIKKILVITPVGVMGHWQNEIEKYSEYTSIILHANNREDRLEKLKQENYQFYIINYESLYKYR